MARKKRRKRKAARKSPNGKSTSKQPFNPALDTPPTASPVAPRTEAPAVHAAPENPPEPPDDSEQFLRAVSDVEPLSPSKRRLPPVPDLNVRPLHPADQDELEAMAHLSDLVSGTAEMDITFSDEYIEGAVQGVGRKLMKRLRQGKFPIQDYVDLHGLTQQEAETKVRDFLIQSHRNGLRCVLVVHGRGLNSENHIPVLKRRLPVWLTRGPVRKIVLAFSTARVYDGGTGALYILLKRRP